MPRNHNTTIRSLLLSAACLLATPIQPAAAKPAAKPQGLWVGGYKYFYEFQGKALKKSGESKANLVFGSTAYFNPRSMTFDGNNDLWITFDGINDNLPAPIVELSHSDFAALKGGNGVKPKVHITEQGSTGIPFTVPGDVAFDQAGDLWVSNQGGQTIMDFTPSQIKKSGSPSPTILLAADFVPVAMRFDASNNLWVEQYQVPYNPSNPLEMGRYAPGDRATSGPATPSLVVTLPQNFNPVDVAFDSAGNLWLAGPGSQGDEIEMFPASDLTGSGEISPTAAVTITSSAFGSVEGSGSCLGGIDFDHTGDLWVSVGADNADCQSSTQIVDFTPSQLGIGGALTPPVTIEQKSNETNLFIPGPIRFGPTP
jgi:hypothetical protein